MTDEQRTMFIRACGLLGIQMTQDVAYVIEEIREHIITHNNISMADVDAIDKKTQAKFPKPPPKLQAVKGGKEEQPRQ